MDSDDDTPKLSANALAALQSFLQSEEAEAARFEELANEADKGFVPFIEAFKEDWNLSQFWYTEATAETLAQFVKSIAPTDGMVVCVSCPTLFFHLAQDWNEKRLRLLEFDDRFQTSPAYTRYDYKYPLALPAELIGKADVIVLDPPFLSEECWTKFAITVRKLSKPHAKVIACTGLTMKDLVYRLLKLRLVKFEPVHKNGLSNEFGCYVDFDSGNPLFQPI